MEKKDLLFPDIDYPSWHGKWSENIGRKVGYTDKNTKGYISLIGDINTIEDKILALVRTEDLSKANILYLVDLIYQWGGKQSRLFYARKKNDLTPRQWLERDEVFTVYDQARIEAMQGKPQSESLFKSIYGIGHAYAGKHAFFWSLKYPGKTLIIVDNKIAGMFGYRTPADLYQTTGLQYPDLQRLFVDKSQEVFGDTVPHWIERALFAYHEYKYLNKNDHL